MGIDEGTPVTEAYTSHGSRFTGKGRESDRGGRVTEERKPVAPTGIWQRVARALFDEEAVEEIFVHARNLVVGTLNSPPASTLHGVEAGSRSRAWWTSVSPATSSPPWGRS